MNYGSIKKDKTLIQNGIDFQVFGNLKLTLIGTSLIGMISIATSAVLLANTRNYLKDENRMPALNNSVASSIFVATPTLMGFLLRIPYSMLLVNHSSMWLHLSAMVITVTGVIVLMILSVTTGQLAQLNTGVYMAYVFFGVVSGVGMAVFPIGVTTCSFWTPQEKQGWINGIYGGLVNLGPGIMNILVAKLGESTSLGVIFLIWIVILVIIVIIATPLISDSPYHQIVFRMKEKHISQQQRKEIQQHCKTVYNQDIFPNGTPSGTLKQSARSFHTWALVHLSNVCFGGFLALAVYLPTFFHDGFDEISTAAAGYYASLFTIIAACIRIPAGFISDKITFMDGGIFIEYLGLILIITGSIVTTLFESFEINMAAIIIVALGMGIGNAGIYKILPKVCRDTLEGSNGWVSLAFGSLLWPIIMGIIEIYNIHLVFILFVVISLIGVMLTVMMHVVM